MSNKKSVSWAEYVVTGAAKSLTWLWFFGAVSGNCTLLAESQTSDSALPQLRDLAGAVERLGSDRYVAIKELRALGTDEARKVLLEVALGRRGAGQEGWALCPLSASAPRLPVTNVETQSRALKLPVVVWEDGKVVVKPS